LGLAALAGATPHWWLVAFTHLVFFYQPSDLKAKAVAADRRVLDRRAVEAQGLSRRAPNGRSFSFRLPDGSTIVGVVYQFCSPTSSARNSAVLRRKAAPGWASSPPRVCSPSMRELHAAQVVDSLKQVGRLAGARNKDAARRPPSDSAAAVKVGDTFRCGPWHAVGP